MLEKGTISTRGLKPGADVFAEMVFDVNTMYFDEYGGYNYPKNFFEEAYKMAVKEGVLSRGKIDSLKKQLWEVTNQLRELEDKFAKLFMSTRDYTEAIRLAPQRVKEVFSEIFQKVKEERERKKMLHKQHRGRSR